ncbi:MAG: hypothetical protein HYS18_09755 [Burkholderiales bacterium]|nr:hypothetical protein [Burkholderiales bacterium]
MNTPSSANLVAPSTGKKILRAVSLLARGIAVVVIGLLAIGLLVNLIDEKLKPETQALLAPPAYHANPAVNGYFIFRAMDADASLDAMKTGSEAVESEQRLFKENPNRSDYDKQITYKKMPKPVWNQARCGEALQNCVEADLRNRAQLEDALAKNAVYLKRYDAMRQLPEFEERLLLSMAAPFPNYSLLAQTSDMTVAKAALDIADGRTQSGLAQLESNDRYLRSLLVKTNTLLGRMVAMGALRRQARTVSDLVEMYPQLLVQQGDALAKLVRPLTLNDQLYAPVMMNEARSIAGAIQSATAGNLISYVGSETGVSMSDRFANWVASLGFKRNATLNLFADTWKVVIDNANQPPSEYGKARERVNERIVQLFAPSRIPYVHYFSNPVGKILLEVASSPDMYVKYMERGADTDGYLRLVGLQVDLRRNKVAMDAIPAYLAKAPEQFRSPYDQKTMAWDAKQKQLQFEGRQKLNTNFKGGNVFIVQLK